MDHLYPLSAFCKFQKLNVKGSRVMLLFFHGQRDEGTLMTIVDVIVNSFTHVKLILLLSIVTLSYVHTSTAWTAVVQQQTLTV